MGIPPYERVDTGSEEPVIRAYGASVGEVFENAALGMFAIGYELEAVPPTYARPIVAVGDTIPILLVAWLEELIAMSAHEQVVPSFFMVDRLEEGGVLGSASGLFASDVVRRDRLVVGVSTRRPEFVEIPDGWWVDLRFTTQSALRLA